MRKRRPKLVSKSAFLDIFIITGLKSDMILSVVDRNVLIFYNPTHDNSLWVSREPEQIIAKFAYSLLSQMKYDYFDISKSFLWL